MKRTMSLCIMLSFFASIIAQNEKLIDQKVFDVKSGMIEYKIEGKTKGTKTLWWDDYGRLQHEYKKTSTKMFGMTTKEEVLTIKTKEWIYTINLIDKTGTKSSQEEAMLMAEALMGSSSEADLIKMGEDIQKDLDAEIVDNESILGRSCTVMDIGKLNGKSWTYKRIPLKTEIKMGGILGDSLEEAIKMEENISVSGDKFKVPSGIEITTTSMYDN